MNADEHWMTAALAEAAKGVGKTAPNPPVGAVIVKDGEMVGAGWHRAAGQPHAEREALADAFRRHGGHAARGATVYVTLEPCSTHGRTPPCTDGLIAAGIARVVYATDDRNRAHQGRGAGLLRAAGIGVQSGVCEPAALRLLRPFFKVRETGLPWVIWKMAMSLDGRITRPHGESRWLTGEAARADVQRLRATVDAILTSGETVRRDNPALTIRDVELLTGRLQPWRVVFTDRPDALPASAEVLSDEFHSRTLLRGAADPAGTLRRLAAEQGVLTAMIEAGGVFSAAMFEAGLIDEAVIYQAPILCGGTTPGIAGPAFAKSLRLEDIETKRIGDDLRISGIISGAPRL